MPLEPGGVGQDADLVLVKVGDAIYDFKDDLAAGDVGYTPMYG